MIEHDDELDVHASNVMRFKYITFSVEKRVGQKKYML